MIKLAAAGTMRNAHGIRNNVMKVDWDDLVSSRLVEWLVSAETKLATPSSMAGVWQSNSPPLDLSARNSRSPCGSCLIIRSDLADLTDHF